MRKIIYAGGEFLTGDRLAGALLAYSRALAEVAQADAVDLPVRSDDGTRSIATLLVGPASQIVAVDVEGASDEIIDDLVVARLNSLTRALRPSAALDQGPLLEDPRWPDDI